jgi:hypothetical protein
VESVGAVGTWSPLEPWERGVRWSEWSEVGTVGVRWCQWTEVSGGSAAVVAVSRLTPALRHPVRHLVLHCANTLEDGDCTKDDVDAAVGSDVGVPVGGAASAREGGDVVGDSLLRRATDQGTVGIAGSL